MEGVDSNRVQRHVLAIAGLLTLVTCLAYFGVWRHDFVNYDDNTYVFLNPGVKQGLSWQTVVWALSYIDIGHWIPMTWLSFASDYQVYGLNPAGFHVTNLALHAANVLLLFFLLRLMTGALWRSALIAAVWGVHPL